MGILTAASSFAYTLSFVITYPLIERKRGRETGSASHTARDSETCSSCSDESTHHHAKYTKVRTLHPSNGKPTSKSYRES